MLANATRICDANFGVLFRFERGCCRGRRNASAYRRHLQSSGNADHNGRDREPRWLASLRRDRRFTSSDVTTEPAYIEGEPVFVAAVNLGRFRTILTVPMLKENELIGAFAIYRQEVRPFTDKQIDLVKNFANQAVIAIENRGCSTNCENRCSSRPPPPTCSRSSAARRSICRRYSTHWPKSATRLCEADHAWLFQREGDLFRWVASFGPCDRRACAK